jgi:hypothetical protein
VITFFYAKFLYLNPGMPLLYEELERRQAAGVRVCNVTACSIADILRLVASSQAIVIDTSIQDAATWTVPGKFSIYFIVDQRPASFYDDVLEHLLNADLPKLFALYVDLHDVKNEALINRIRGRIQAISWSFERKPRAVSDVRPEHRDHWLSDDHDPVRLWQLTRNCFPVRVDLPFSLARHEYYESWPRHLWDACVPGSPYLTRRVAQRSLRRSGVRVAPFHLPSRVLAAAMRHTLPRVLGARRASDVAIRAQQSFQRTLVRSAPISFVCGGPLAFPVRKFFEIPAARVAMIADPCPEMTDYGFKDGTHFIATTPEDAGRVAKALLRSRAEITRLAAAAFDTVRSLHSVERRADQLIECVRRLMRGSLHSARFVRGDFVIES